MILNPPFADPSMQPWQTEASKRYRYTGYDYSGMVRSTPYSHTLPPGDPLVGMALLSGSELRIKAVAGGTVEIRELS